MPDTEYQRLIHIAKERASSGFLALAQRAVQDADKEVADALARARSGADHTALTSVRHFLRQEGNVFLQRIQTLYRRYLDRAMQTMYVDLRRDMRKLSIDELSLIDDEVVNHQIEVGRLTERMREANEEAIGRLNVIVARMHGDAEARERENPFRPYLLARSLYEAILETAGDEAKTRLLFQHLANALIQHLPAYYSSIREVFEASGVRGDFLAQRSRAAHNQRYFGAPPDTLVPGARNADSRVLSGLEKMLAAVGGPTSNDAARGDPGTPADNNRSVNLHEIIRKMLAPSRPFGAAAVGEAIQGTSVTKAAPVNPLVAKLSEMQKALSAQGTDSAQLRDAAQIREQLNLDSATVEERMTVDVMSMLFELILDDPQIPAELRLHLGCLQIPLLKAALLQPDLLRDDRHPARRLLNRMSTAGVGVDPAAEAGRVLIAEAGRIVRKVLAEFDADMAAFSAALGEFEAFLENYLREDDKETKRGIDAVEAAERFSVLLTNATTALCDAMLSLNVDKRISDCVIHVWPHVLVHAALHDAEQKLSPDNAHSLYQRYHSVLPELLWSVQEKTDPQQRAGLIKLLPNLVKRLRAGLQLIQLPEEECRQILDQMVELHTAVLRGGGGANGAPAPTLDELNARFSQISIRWDRASWSLDEPPQARASVIEDIFARKEVAADLRLGVKAVTATAAERNFLAQTYLLGTRVEFRADDAEPVTGQLVWTSTHRSLYLFKKEGSEQKERDGGLVLYTYASLIEALRDGMVVPVEAAPVFDRAVESLLYGAANMPAEKA
ncbi:DUF1631 domain-containing protein [Noviherbaspirillum agri]